MKPCNQCGEVRPARDYPPNDRLISGRGGTCKLCCRKRTREWVRARRNDPEWRQKHNEGSRRTRLAWYGITEDEYAEILAVQGGVCAGCKRPPSDTRNLDVDHKHQRGDKRCEPLERAAHVRGLLCHRCNRGLGLMGENPETLRRLADYLEAPPALPIVKRFIEQVVAYLEAYEKRRPATVGSRRSRSRSAARASR